MTSPLRDLPVGGTPNQTDLEGVDSESISDGRRSRHSSIAGPYRYGVPEETSFPTYCPSAPLHDIQISQAYSRSLLPLGNGFAVYDVIGNLDRPTKHMELGVLVGDVGYLDRTGDFRFLCNIFSPQTDEIHAGMQIPNFVPLPPPLAEDIVETANYFKPGTIMASEGVGIRHTSKSPLKVEFTSTASDAAVLILPTGAIREELVNISSIVPYVNAQAPIWYNYCNGGPDVLTAEPIANGTICVVVGVDRADSCAMATLSEKPGKRSKFFYSEAADEDKGVDQDTSQDAGRDVEEHSDDDSDGDSDGSNAVRRSRSPWSNDHHCRPYFQAHKLSDGKLAPVFLRVLSVALNPIMWFKHVAFIIPEHMTYYGCVRNPFESKGLFARLRQYFSSGAGLPHSADGEPILFHPSIALLHILLLTHPTADVGIVSDSTWISQLSKRYLTHAEVVALIRRVINVHDLAIVDGVAQFIAKTEATIPILPRKRAGIVSRWVPWITRTSKEEPNVALGSMTKVLGIRKP